jgi:hypothetical protein
LVIDFDPGGMARPVKGLPGGIIVSLALPIIILFGQSGKRPMACGRHPLPPRMKNR